MERENEMGMTGQQTVDGALSVTMSRRRVLRLLGAAGATAVLAGAVRATPASAAQQLRTLSSLNLRAKPSSSARVLRVMPEGAIVTRIPGGTGRYVKVVYDGTRGYAHLDYLDDATDQGDGGGEDPVIVGTGKTITDVNLRSGPSTGHTVLRVLDPHVAVSVSDTVRNGFRYVVHNGLAGWVWDAYLGQAGGAGEYPEIVGLTSTTTDANLRSGSSTGSAVIRVLAPGAVVNYSFTIENGFRQVQHQGQWGWVWDAFLDFQAGPERRVTTSAVNHRAEASTSAKILAVIPGGTIVGDLEESANGFRKVSYNGAIGWCWADYLN